MLLRKCVSPVMVAGLIVLASNALAARGRMGPQALPKGAPITAADPIKGTIEMTPQGARVVVGNDNWGIFIAPNPKIRVMGTAQIDYVRAGQLVRFSAMYDKKENSVKDPIAKMTIFTPFPEEFSPGGTPDTEPVGAAATGDYKAMILTGLITKIKGTKMTVNIPGISGKLNVELAESVAISLNIADFTVIKQGDGIIINSGEKYVANTGEKAIKIKEAKITLVEPVAGPTTKRKGPRNLKSREPAVEKEKPAKKEKKAEQPKDNGSERCVFGV